MPSTMAELAAAQKRLDVLQEQVNGWKKNPESVTDEELAGMLLEVASIIGAVK